MTRRRIRAVAGALVVVVVAAVGVAALAGHSSTTRPATPAGPRTLTVATRQVSVDGLARDFILVRPTRPDGAMLVVLPGLTESVDQVRSSSDADSLAVSEGVTVAYLGGYMESWNAGTCCGTARTDALDDVATVRNVAQAVVAQNRLDPHRVFIAGHSNGALMTLRLACDTRDVYAGYLSVSGALVTDCPDPGPATMVFWQGVRDTTVPVNGGTTYGVKLPPLTTTLAPFTAGCGQPVRSEADAVTASYSWNCPGADGTRQVYLSATGTHDWPDPPGQLIARAWAVFATSRAAGGV